MVLTVKQASLLVRIQWLNPLNSYSKPPADIVKVRLQTTNQYSSALDCAAKILRNEGPLAFYKGTLTPLVGIGACVSNYVFSRWTLSMNI
jgi:Mitochondrial carrier protein